MARTVADAKRVPSGSLKTVRQLAHDRAASVQEFPTILAGPDLQRVPGRELSNGRVHGMVRLPTPREAQVDVPQAEPPVAAGQFCRRRLDINRLLADQH